MFGFPLSERLSSNFTMGTVTSLSIRNNSSILQISAPIQPGNSGAPILDESGTVIGVVVAKLSPIVGVQIVIPENINFGIRSQVVDAFLHSEDISLPLPVAQSGQKLDPPKIAEMAKASSMKIYCKKIDDPRIVKVSCKIQDGTLKDRELGIAINLPGKTATVETISPASNDRVRLRVVDATDSKIRLAGEKWLLGSSKLSYPVIDIDLNAMRLRTSVCNQSVSSEPKPEDVVPNDWGDVPVKPSTPADLGAIPARSTTDFTSNSKIETASGVCRRVP